MKLVMLTMRDSKVGIYLQPFAVLSIASGVRDLQEMLNDTNKQFPWQKFPQDFDLFEIGEFDGDTGRIIGHEPVTVMNLGALKLPSQG